MKAVTKLARLTPSPYERIVDDQLAALLLREVTPVLDRLVLGVVGRARVPVHLTRPSIAVWHYVNIAHAARLPGAYANSPVGGAETPSPLVRLGTDRPGALAGPLRSGASRIRGRFETLAS